MHEKAGKQLEPPGGGRPLSALEARVEAVEREFAMVRKLIEATTAPEPWLDYDAVAAHYSVGRRTVELWKRKGMPMPLHEGKRKGQLSTIEPWLRQHGYLPGGGDGEIVPIRPTESRAIGGSDAEAA